MRRVCWSVLVALLLALPAWAQFWEKKQWSQWSQSECGKMHTDSPWAKSRTLTTVTIQTLQEQAAVDGRDAAPSVTYRALLWSARPVREAQARLMQLAPQYGQLSPEDKKAADERLEKLLNADFTQHVVIRLFYNSPSPALNRDLVNYWQTRPPEELKKTTTLLVGKKKIYAVQVNISKGGPQEIQLWFPRAVDGQLIAGPQDNALSLELEHPGISPTSPQRVLLSFEVKKMKVSGNLLF